MEGIQEGGLVGLARLADRFGGGSGQRNWGQAIQAIEPLVHCRLEAVFPQNLKSVLAQAQTTHGGSLAQDTVKLVG